jgi:hypothetical protein
MSRADSLEDLKRVLSYVVVPSDFDSEQFETGTRTAA